MTADLTSPDTLDHVRPGSPPPFGSICARIAAQAQSRPRGIAAADPAGALTYSDLVQEAGGLATRLRDAGVGVGSCVAVFAERTPAFVAAALGVLWAGAAYLPIDTATPRERVELVLDDADVATVVTTQRLQPRLPGGRWRPLLLDGPDDPGPRSTAAAPADVGPDDLAYVIYTSGSAGRPKGVELTHANLINLVEWHVTTFALRSSDRASQVAGLGFDAAVWEIWPTLAAGAALHFADDATRRSPHLLRDWLLHQQIAVGFVPTVMAEQMLHLAWPRRAPLRTMLTGADVLHRRPPSDLPFRLVNNYGPTECTVVATSGVVGPDDDGQIVPAIGRPIADTTALILDGELNPVAPGTPGELCLSGALVGRGYRKDPELTADRFVSVVVNGDARRAYRTGDQVRLLDSGEIAFVGRLDKQVKIRGFRVEPAEIVTALDRVPGVASAAVVAHTASAAEQADPEQAPELVAYVVAADGASVPAAAQVRELLAATLPEYMIPTRFVSVDALPLTINGKLDEAALRARGAEQLLRERRGAGDAAPAVEEQITAMVHDLVKNSAVAQDDNIFLVGGHSMLAMQLALRVKQTFGVKLSLRQVFGAPTIAELAAEVGRQLAGRSR